jgi:diguanylate cyclase (GGDEF)-like protein
MSKVPEKLLLSCDAERHFDSQEQTELCRVKKDAPIEQFKIVVADDSPVYRMQVERILAREGYAVFPTKNGREAALAVGQHQPSVVITDWEMPDLTGIELCKEIRRDQVSYTYVIVLTSHTEKDQVIEGLSAGADDYLTKPFHTGELLARVAVGRRVAELHRQIQAKNRLLEQLALTDPLTGLPNRRAIDDWAGRELAAAARHGFPLWVAMADLDHFKNINDSHGHESGDIVLRRFADVLRANTRASNMCARIGGEEFVTVLAHTDKAGVQTAIERIRQQFEAQHFSFVGRLTAATASFGIAGFRGSDEPSFDQLLRCADAALYRAKRMGRNRLVFAS